MSTPKPVRKLIVAKKTVRLTLVLMPISLILALTFSNSRISRCSWAKALTTLMPDSASDVRSVRFDQVSPQRVK